MQALKVLAPLHSLSAEAQQTGLHGYLLRVHSPAWCYLCMPSFTVACDHRVPNVGTEPQQGSKSSKRVQQHKTQTVPLLQREAPSRCCVLCQSGMTTRWSVNGQVGKGCAIFPHVILLRSTSLGHTELHFLENLDQVE